MGGFCYLELNYVFVLVLVCVFILFLRVLCRFRSFKMFSISLQCCEKGRFKFFNRLLWWGLDIDLVNGQNHEASCMFFG